MLFQKLPCLICEHNLNIIYVVLPAGIQTVLKTVIDDLRVNTKDVIDEELLEAFHEFTEHTNKLFRRGERYSLPLNIITTFLFQLW